MLEVMYELREHRKIDEGVTSDEIAYMRKISEEKPYEPQKEDKVVKVYQH